MIGLAAFVGIVLVRLFVEKRVFAVNPDNTLPLFWYTHFAMISVSGLIAFLYGFFGDIKGKWAKVIAHLGNMTFYIYLIHYIIKDKLNAMGMQGHVLSFVKGNTYAYMLVYTAMVFLISLVFAEIINVSVKALKRIIGSKKGVA